MSANINVQARCRRTARYRLWEIRHTKPIGKFFPVVTYNLQCLFGLAWPVLCCSSSSSRSRSRSRSSSNSTSRKGLGLTPTAVLLLIFVPASSPVHRLQEPLFHGIELFRQASVDATTKRTTGLVNKETHQFNHCTGIVSYCHKGNTQSQDSTHGRDCS
jgi:hypothetical protein